MFWYFWLFSLNFHQQSSHFSCFSRLVFAYISSLRLWVLQHWFRIHHEKDSRRDAFQLTDLQEKVSLISEPLSITSQPRQALVGPQGSPGSQLATTTNPLYCDNHCLSCPPWGPSPKAPLKSTTWKVDVFVEDLIFWKRIIFLVKICLSNMFRRKETD